MARMEKEKKKIPGSMTIEAAIVVPIFLYAILIFLYFFQLLMIQTEVQKSLDETAKYYSKNAYLYCNLLEEGAQKVEKLTDTQQALIEAVDLKQMVANQIYEAKFDAVVNLSQINQKLLVGGLSGINIRQQKDYYDDDVVDLCAYYECQIPVLFFRVNSLSCVQRVHMVNWTGVDRQKLYGQKEEDSADEEMVYIAETGTRYHRYEDCSHLKLSIHTCTYAQIGFKRNTSGGKYKPCHLCVGNKKISEDTIVYYTDDGDRYHVLKECSSLKRTVKQVKLSEVETTMPECSRCKKRHSKE